MNVKNIVLKDMVLQADKGLDMTEGTGITLQNITLIAKNTDPLMNIHNSQNIVLKAVKYNNADVMLNVTGEKSKGIVLNGVDAKKAKKGVEVNYGATEAAVKMM